MFCELGGFGVRKGKREKEGKGKEQVVDSNPERKQER
jgi:hypothetical protein